MEKYDVLKCLVYDFSLSKRSLKIRGDSTDKDVLQWLLELIESFDFALADIEIVSKIYDNSIVIDIKHPIESLVYGIDKVVFWYLLENLCHSGWCPMSFKDEENVYLRRVRVDKSSSTKAGTFDIDIQAD